MTNRLYYTDAYTSRFNAQIVEQLHYKEQPAVILNETLFYPTSGGQPHDVGLISGHSVVDVLVRPEDEAVIHLLEGRLPSGVGGQTVEATLDWGRRFDHMQQHCGQHILSRAFIEVAGAETVGFHLGDLTCTIDVDRLDLTDDMIAEAERLANQIIWDNRKVEVRFVTQAEADELPLRKRPPIKGDSLRLVDITGFDLCACGGTHVAQTGEIGQLKILRTEKRKKKKRIEFVCGKRALRDYDHKNSVIQALMKAASTRASELEESFAKQQEELRRMGKELKRLNQTLAAYEAKRLEARFEPAGSVNLLTHVFEPGEKSLDSVKPLANQLVSIAGRVVCFGVPGSEGMFYFRRSDDLDLHMGDLIKSLLQSVEGGRGGGRPDQAQGGGIPLSKEEMETLLRSIREKQA